MNIDWFTFVAQIINFLILVGLLRWFLYDPIVQAMQQREEKIASRWKDAQRKSDEAEKKALQLDLQSRELEQNREELLQEALRDAHEHRERLMREARDDVERKRNEWMSSLAREKHESLDEIQHQVGELAVEATRRTLSQLADADLEELMVHKLVTRIQQIDSSEQEKLNTLDLSDNPEFLVRSAHRLAEPQKDQLHQAICQRFGEDVRVSFSESEDLICGLQFDVGGYSIDWNVKEFVRQIQAELDERIRRKR